MAAYLGVAAVAAQQSPFLLARRSLLLNRSQSPTFLSQQPSSLEADVPVLDFSTKQTLQKSKNRNDSLDLTKSDDPLDLTITRKRNNSSPVFPANTPKVSKANDYKTPPISSWLSPISPYFGASVAAMSNLSSKDFHPPQQLAWNGVKSKMNVTTDALERMSELSRLNGSESSRQSNGSTSNTASTGRHSAWQSHWLNKGADAVKDVFKCVWCKQSFPTLETLTIHMKETQHLTSGSVSDNHRQMNIPKSHGSQQQVSSHSMSSTTSTVSSESSKSDLGVLIKETMPLPRKLVRGQDVWLGKGAEQTRQILKCMWCGQSFRSLSEMTTHMQQTQHYTNIISQEQIISWKSSDDVKSNAGNSGSNSNANTGISSGSISTVSAVLTCKVCDEAFSSLKDLSNHMVKNAHYKEHIMRSISESGGRRKQTREKRKKSLPVRKLLEIERAQNEMKGGENVREFNSVRITCEKCGEKVETHFFVEHIKKCIKLNSEKKSLDIIPLTMNKQESGLSAIEGSHDEISADTKKKMQSNSFSEPLGSDKDEANIKNDNKKSPSVLSAIEQLIEKSFDMKTRHRDNSANYSQTVSSSSILQRLGIDESADYTKPLIDSQTFRLLRNLSEQEPLSRRTLRERSISESSSVSDCGSLNSQIEAASPLRRAISRDTNYSQRGSEKSPDINVYAQKNKDELERSTPDSKANSSDSGAKDSCTINDPKTNDDDEQQHRRDCDTFKRSTQSVERISPSPKSDRSSVSESIKIKKENSGSDVGSLGALSSMFDNLSDKSYTANVSDLTDSVRPTRRTSSHPLAALQKLCDKTESHPPKNRQQIVAASAPIALLDSQNQPSTTSSYAGSNNTVSTSSNDAKTCDDSLNKCSLCDTYFSSKASYRQHLSKVHFCKSDEASELSRYSASPQNHSPKSSSSFSSSHGNEFIKLEKTPSSEIRTSPPASSLLNEVNCDESPHSKFLKYTELAKQLSSKYV